MPSSPLASLMRQIEIDMRSPTPPQPAFDAERYFAEGDPVTPTYDPMGSFTGVEGLDQGGREPGAYERLADRLAGAGVAVGEPARQAIQGIGAVPSTIGTYLAETAQKPDPSQRVAEDIRKFGSAFAEQAMSSPTEFAKTVGGFLPGIGEAISAYDAAQVYDDLRKAEAEGDAKKADTLRQLYGLATAGAIPGVGIAARVAGKAKGVVEGAERAGVRGAEEVAAKQAISSAETSIKQIPGLFKSKTFEAEPGARNLDIGGGKFDLGTDYLKNERGVESSVFDPFNRSAEHNAAVLDEFKQNPADTVTAANVLNVIAEPEARIGVIQQAYDHLKPGGKAYFDIYEGNRSGEGAATSKGWQNNMKAQNFMDEVQSVFPDVQRKGTTLIATKPEDAIAAVPEAAMAAEKAASDVISVPDMYQHVRQAFDASPEPVAVRTSVIDHITESIDASDGAKAQLPTRQGLGPIYLVDSGQDAAGKGFLLNTTKNANAEKQIAGIDPLLQQFPEMGMNPDQWAKGMSQAFGSREVIAPPYRFMKAIDNGEYTDLLRTLTPGQIADADAGFAAGKEFLNAYHSGQMGVEDTGKLFMWGMLSRGVNPFTHEGLFLDAFEGIEPFIKMAAEGKLTKEVAEGPYKDWAATTAAKGSGQPGAGAMHNLNAFGSDFLVKMGTPGKDGVTPLQKMHDMMSDPEMSGRQIRREFAKVGEGVGIDNKVVSFALLATGRDDVMVIDRIQLKNLWDDGRYGDINIWDGVSVPVAKLADGSKKRFPPTDEGRAAQRAFIEANPGSKGENAAVTGSSLAEATYGAKGILVYEALEDALMKNVGKMYEELGRPQAASPGRFHWETWVARSNQEASHGTLPAILEKAKGNPNPLGGVYSKQGDYQSYAYGAKYGRSAEGNPQFSIPLSTGSDITMSPEQYAAALKIISKPSSGVIPNVKGQKFLVTETEGMPWYEREGVNRARLDEILQQAAAGQAGVIRKADGGPISYGSRDGSAGGRAAKTYPQGYASGGRAVVGHTKAAGFPISLEEHKGEIRHRAHSGDSKMAADYGYISNSKPDADGMKVDAYVGPHKDSDKVFVINQQHPHTKRFNEHKVMLGYKDRSHAVRDYTHSFSDGLGHKRIHSIVEMDSKHLRDWLRKGNHKQPLHGE